MEENVQQAWAKIAFIANYIYLFYQKEKYEDTLNTNVHT
jgi:hypothetical protein